MRYSQENVATSTDHFHPGGPWGLRFIHAQFPRITKKKKSLAHT